MTVIGNDRATIHVGDAKECLQGLAENSVHTCVTSPPYWGLRDYNEEDQIGLEPTPEEYVENLVEVFREVNRVLREDGTLWLNLGDSYCAGRSGGSSSTSDEKTWAGNEHKEAHGTERSHVDWGSLKQKDLVGIPWRVAFALQRDGWWLRKDIIWAKGISGDERMGQCMPESVTDRPTSAHEYVFLLSPSKSYFYDDHAIKEDTVSGASGNVGGVDNHQPDDRSGFDVGFQWDGTHTKGNIRDVWHTAPGQFPDAHFAVYPPDLIRPCVKAGTSANGACITCGAPYERRTSKDTEFRSGSGQAGNTPDGKWGEGHQGGGEIGDVRKGPTPTIQTVGWEPTCDCDTDETVPCRVLDPFLGAGTTALVALQEGRHAVGIELNEEYARMAWDRIQDLAETQRLDAFTGGGGSP